MPSRHLSADGCLGRNVGLPPNSPEEVPDGDLLARCLLVDTHDSPLEVASGHPPHERLSRDPVVLRNFDSVKGTAAVSFSAKRLNGVDLRSASGRHQRRDDCRGDDDCCRSYQRNWPGKLEFRNVIAGQA
jgi:hypothetical protein